MPEPGCQMRRGPLPEQMGTLTGICNRFGSYEKTFIFLKDIFSNEEDFKKYLFPRGHQVIVYMPECMIKVAFWWYYISQNFINKDNNRYPIILELPKSYLLDRERGILYLGQKRVQIRRYINCQKGLNILYGKGELCLIKNICHKDYLVDKNFASSFFISSLLNQKKHHNKNLKIQKIRLPDCGVSLRLKF